MQCRLRDRRSRLFSLGLRPCPLRTEIPPDSLNLLIMLCTVEGEISKSYLVTVVNPEIRNEYCVLIKTHMGKSLFSPELKSYSITQWNCTTIDPLLFLSCRSGGRRRRRVQRYLGSGALALRRGVASGWAWTPSRLLSPSRLRGGNGRCRFRGLLSRRSPGATLSSCWAGALGQEVSHSLWRLLCLREALSESFHHRSKEAAGGNWSIKEGDPVRVLDLRQHEPQVALEHYRLAIDLPMAWAVVLVARKARSMLLRWTIPHRLSQSAGTKHSAGRTADVPLSGCIVPWNSPTLSWCELCVFAGI